MTVQRLLAELRGLASGAADVPRDEVPGLIAALGAAQGALVARAVSTPPPTPIAPPAPAEERHERTLTVAETAARFGRGRHWVYRHARELPGRVALPGGGYGFRERSIERWIQRNG